MYTENDGYEVYINNIKYRQQIPSLYKNCKFDDLKGNNGYLSQVNKIKDWKYSDPSLLSMLSRKNGVGKTHIAWCLTLRYFFFNSKFNSERCFFKEYEILNLIKSTYDDNGVLNEEQQKKAFIKKPILVIDDLFRTKRNDWALSVMFEIIDARLDWLRPTIITSNLTLEEIHDLDSSIASRINNSMLFQFEGDLKDWRAEK